MMELLQVTPAAERETFYRWANALALITIFYNVIEGVVSVVFGYEDGTISLFGFGVDSFVEVISGIGIWHMVIRMRKYGAGNRDDFEKTALRVTGTAFYILTIGLTVTAAINVMTASRPRTTFWGVVVGGISIISMWALIHYKMKIGRRFNSDALIADARCTRTCLYLSGVLLAASIGYEVTGIGLLDSLGAGGIAVLAFREGREAFEKARGGPACSCGGSCRE